MVRPMSLRWPHPLFESPRRERPKLFEAVRLLADYVRYFTGIEMVREDSENALHHRFRR